MTALTLILIAAAAMAVIGLLSLITWFLYTGYLTRLERRLAARKGVYRQFVAELASRERDLLEPMLHQAGTLHDFEALEAVLEEQARSSTERPAWLLEAYDNLGLIDKYIERLRNAKKWRERAFAAELLGRVGNAQAVVAMLETIQATRTEDADVREITLRALARIADPRAVEPLVEALKKAEGWLAPRIADIIARHGDQVIDPMIAFLEEPSRHPARAWAANILGELRASRAFPALVRALSDLDDEVRAKSAGALGKLGDRRALTYLLDHLLSDPAPFVRARIAGALGQFGDPEVIERLVRALGDPAWWVRMRSVEALEQIGPVAEAPLMLALDDPDAEIRIRAAVALERLGVPGRIIGQIERMEDTRETHDLLVKFGIAGARELLAEHLLHPSPRVRTAVIEAVRRTGRRDLTPELIEVARRDTEPRIRTGALETLHALGAAEAGPAALEAIGDADSGVRTAAMELVGALGGDEVTSVIVPRTSDPEPAVRAAAARALGLLKAKTAQLEFARLLEDPAPEVRAAAAQGVADSGRREAVPKLVQLLEDSDESVRMAAARGIGMLGTSAAVPALLRVFRAASSELRDVITSAVAQLDLNSLPTLLDVLLENADVDSRLAVARTIGRLRVPAPTRLLETLWRDPDPAVRAATAEVLGRLGDLQAATPLRQGLSDPDETVRARAVDALLRLHSVDAGSEIVALLARDPSPKVRERAALAVGLFRVAGGEVELLKACVSSQPLNVRAAATLAIGAYDQESIIARVLDMADEQELREVLRERLRHDPEFRLIGLKLRDARHVELRALGATTREQMEATLAEGMRGVLNPEERIRLVQGLRAFQGERSRSALLQAIRGDPSPEVRAAALTAVGGLLDVEELLLTASRALADPNLGVRRAAVSLFSRIAAKKSLPALIRTLHADDDELILQAVAAQAEGAFEAFVDLVLGMDLDGREGELAARIARFMHHPELKRLLPRLAQARSPAVREAVARVWVDRPDLLDPAQLETLSEDPEVMVRRAAVQAWIAGGRYDRAECMLGDPDPGVRQELTRGLLAAPAAPALARLLQDPDEMVRAMAFVIRLLRGETTEPPKRPPVSRSAAVTAVRQAINVDELRETASSERDPRRRQAAALALAVLDDDSAHAIQRSDPLGEVRERVTRMLMAWPAQSAKSAS